MFKSLLTKPGKTKTLAGPVLPPLDMPQTVTVRGEPRPLRVRKHASARRMILRFDPRSGEGRLTVPPGTPASAARTFLSQSRTWIDANAPEAKADGAPFPQMLDLDGVPHILVRTGKARGLVTVSDGQIHVPGPPHRVMARVARHLKTQAENRLTPMVMEAADALGKRPSAVRYRDPRSQWGSCSSSRIITLSWRVMMAPPEAQRYLVAHEVAHLAEMNHSQRFWNTVARLDPDWKRGQRALKRAEKALMALSFS
ncbi:MAG: M48 family metallopeptidase [Devosiaceae bacterium]|nr:M48 family metallopeptidase [Devosiaceae bacterium MH13]